MMITFLNWFQIKSKSKNNKICITNGIGKNKVDGMHLYDFIITVLGLESVVFDVDVIRISGIFIMHKQFFGRGKKYTLSWFLH